MSCNLCHDDTPGQTLYNLCNTCKGQDGQTCLECINYIISEDKIKMRSTLTGTYINTSFLKSTNLSTCAIECLICKKYNILPSKLKIKYSNNKSCYICSSNSIFDICKTFTTLEYDNPRLTQIIASVICIFYINMAIYKKHFEGEEFIKLFFGLLYVNCICKIIKNLQIINNNILYNNKTICTASFIDESIHMPKLKNLKNHDIFIILDLGVEMFIFNIPIYYLFLTIMTIGCVLNIIMYIYGLSKSFVKNYKSTMKHINKKITVVAV